MATTTNYAWETPDDTDLVKDGAAAIRTLGSSIDTTTKALNPSTTLGDIEYRSATANTNTRLGIGSTGQVLTVSGGVPTWAAPAGGGKVLQLVTATYSTQMSTNSNSYVDTGLTASITPSATTSKVLVIVSHTNNQWNTQNGFYIQLLRGSSPIWTTDLMGLMDSNYTVFDSWPYTFAYVDSPSTTSSTTYKTQFKSRNSTSVYAQKNNATSMIQLLEIGA